MAHFFVLFRVSIELNDIRIFAVDILSLHGMIIIVVINICFTRPKSHIYGMLNDIEYEKVLA